MSRAVLYSCRTTGAVLLTAMWGVLVAYTVRFLIAWLQPGNVERWLLGYALGAYISIPNFGLFQEDTIPLQNVDRHRLVSQLPWLVYIGMSIALAEVGGMVKL